MKRGSGKLYFLSGLVEFLVGPFMIAFGFIQRTIPTTYSTWPAPAAKFMAWCQQNSFPIFVSLGVLAIVAWALRRWGNPWFWEKLQALLDKCQEVAYERFQGQIRDHHRVTLFRYTGWYWCWGLRPGGQWYRWGRMPWSGWLVPVLRSGKTSQKTKAAFLTPDNGNLAEGIAGLAWASNSIAFVDQLAPPDSSSTEQQVRQYAERTNCSIVMINNYIKERRPLPGSIGANIIDVKGEPWGVLVLDSIDAQGVNQQLMQSFKVAMLSISQLLEKAR